MVREEGGKVVHRLIEEECILASCGAGDQMIGMLDKTVSR